MVCEKLLIQFSQLTKLNSIRRFYNIVTELITDAIYFMISEENYTKSVAALLIRNKRKNFKIKKQKVLVDKIHYSISFSIEFYTYL